MIFGEKDTEKTKEKEKNENTEQPKKTEMDEFTLPLITSTASRVVGGGDLGAVSNLSHAAAKGIGVRIAASAAFWGTFAAVMLYDPAANEDPNADAIAMEIVRVRMLAEEKKEAEKKEAEKKAKEGLDADQGDNAQKGAGATPPEGLVENPNRKGSFGEYDENGKFVERWRLDEGRSEIKRGHGSIDHIHLNGSKEWTPVGDK